MSLKIACNVVVAAVSVWLGSSVAQAATEAKPTDMSSECISPDAIKTLSECPGGPGKFDVKKTRAAAFHSAPPPREVKKREDDVKPVNPDELKKFAERDTRKNRLQARARALLITEISGLERLYKRTAKKSPDRPQLTRRLAEAYVELESAAQRDKIGADIQGQDAKKKNPAAAAKFRTDALQAEKIAKAAREKAIVYYTQMKNDYPDYSKIDEVLYYLAYEHEQGGNLKDARSVYLELIQKAPKSPFIPYAYLAFGELFFQEAQGDPAKWDVAAQAYKEVIKYPPPTNKQFGYARYKLGYTYWNKGEYANALNEFKKVVEYGDTFVDVPNATQLAKAARRDMIPVYAVSGSPDKAFNFFKPVSGDKGGEQTKTVEMLNELGLAYLDTGHYKEGIVLYRDLLSRDGGARTCFYQGQVTTATQALMSGDKEAVRKELDVQVRVHNDFAKTGAPEQNKAECSNKTAELLAETAMSWHLEAVGTGGVRGTGDKKTMDLAAYLYKRTAENFTAEDFQKFQFPRIVKDDWPTMYKIKYAMADLLYFQQRWEECGPAFDAVVAENPKGDQAAEAAYASVLCYQKMYDQMYKGDSDRKSKGLGPTGSDKDRETKKGEWEKFKPKPFTDMQKGMVTAFNRYVCYITPPKGDKDAEEQFVEVKYARARTYFESQHWEEAALAFRDVAINHADKDAGIFAAQLYLEAVNVLGSRAEPPRPSCFDDMARDVPTFLELYCKGSKFEDNKDQCETLTRIQFDIQRLKAQKLVEKADGQSEKGQYKESLDTYKKGAEAYLELWRGYCEEPLGKGEKPKQCEKANEIVYNMARAYQAARLLAKSIQARLILLSPKYGMNQSDLAMKAIYEIGGNYQAIAVYDRASEYFERYAKDSAYKGEFADQALSDSVVLRLGLGQDEQAIDDANNFNKYFGARKAAQAAQIAFAVASHYGEKKDWNNLEKKLGGAAMRLIDTKATTDIRAQAHALLGRMYVKTSKETVAAKEYASVMKLWADPKAAVASIEGIEGEEAGAKQRRLGRALEAVGEAQFFFAEQKKAKVDKVKFPEYRGPGTKEAVLKHIQTKVKDWIGKKRPLIEDASLEYKKVIDLQPVPPPRWVIAAGSRVGEMWGRFVKEFRAAPIPDGIKKDYELRTSYYGSLDEASEPQKQQAKGAYGVCLGYSVKYQYFDEFSRACEEWLAENYKNEFHVVDEFRGSPNRVNSALREQGSPLRIGGEPMVVQSAEPAEKKKKADDDGGNKKSDKKKDGGA